ncbi:MAG: DUF5916 domain-containing protein [Bacteroidota bacterium]
MRSTKISLILFGLLVNLSLLSAQNKAGTELHIKKAKGKIVLDGVLDEADWQEADVTKDWYQHFPSDSVRSPFQTQARLTFDDDNLYISFVCADDGSPFIVNSLRRDFNYELNDNAGFSIGPYNDKLNGFFFVITPENVQMEGIVTGGGNSGDGFNAFWDNKWFSKTTKHADKWIAEIAIPFKSFRYKSDIREWNISFDRWDLKRNRQSSWINTPFQLPSGSFTYGGQLVWDDPIPEAKTNISFIPYIAGSASADREANPTVRNNDLQAGFDAKIAVTPSLNLDLTVNPDFSQVEVDRQIINLTRFEFQFPERRQFFLENSDLFDLAGFPGARPFFSRRIGLAIDSSGLAQQVPIDFGARLSGSLNEKWRLSVLNMQTRETEAIGLPAQNYTVAAIQRNFWEQSNLTLSFVNKASLNVDLADSSRYFSEGVFKRIQTGEREELRPNTYNRVASLDLEMTSANGEWYLSSFVARSFDDFNDNDNFSGLLFGSYSTRTLNIFGGYSFINDNFNAEAGFVPSARVYPGQFDLFTQAEYLLYPKTDAINVMGPSMNLAHTYIPGGTLTDRVYGAGYGISFSNASRLDLSFDYVFQRLTNTFSLIDADRFLSFQEGEEYDWSSVSVEYQSNPRKLFSYNFGVTTGGFYNGDAFNINGQLTYRYQPYGNISLRFDYNDLQLAPGYGEEQFFLVGPRIDLTFTDKLFLTTFIQYNDLLDNININARFQWRYQPASDLFIVYTENYLPENLQSKNRALVFKMTYWLNL